MRRIGIGLTAALLIAAVAAPAAATKPTIGGVNLVGDHKVTICHATSSDVNPWIVITVDIASSGGRNKLRGHLEHANDPNKQDERPDYIPPFTYPGFDPFPGAPAGAYEDGYVDETEEPNLPSECRGEELEEPEEEQ